ncbi:hypothetical protein [Georgenia yuyongxinii]|uniref:LPXTG-motif cell wall-anchored protein n=1 Tax=Georgenia yuyongxinii TaxID=2589797 RepID=A0A552WM36_9MICO|nr:hypothetical protein [Georgenia yuyongxinii]TRW43817.1 hypothetical protein FJ693_16125 [Georgenia yuyongxinii]
MSFISDKASRTIPTAFGVLALTGGMLIAVTPAVAGEAAVCVPRAAFPAVEAVYSNETETTGWLTSPPASSGWKVLETKSVTDTPAVPGKPAVTHKEYDIARYQRTGWLSADKAPMGWKQVAERVAAEEQSHYVYDIARYQQTDWVRQSPGEGWKQIGERKVVDVKHKDAITEDQREWYRYTKTGDAVLPETHDEYVFERQLPVYTYEKETTGWLRDDPEGAGWTVVESKTVVDVKAQPGTPPTYKHEWSETSPGHGWTQTDEKRQNGTRTIETNDSSLGTVTHELWKKKGDPGNGDWKKTPYNPGHHSDWQFAGKYKVIVPVYEYKWTKVTDAGVQPVTEVSHDEHIFERTIKKQTGTTAERTDWAPAAPEGEGWTQVDKRTVTDKEGYPEQGTQEVVWSKDVPAGEGWVHTGETRVHELEAAIQEESYYEYKYAKYERRGGVTEVPDGWVIKDKRKVVTVEEEREYQYALYEWKSGVTEVPEDWKIKDTRTVVDHEAVPGKPAVTHDEHRYAKTERVLVTPGRDAVPVTDCPVPGKPDDGAPITPPVVQPVAQSVTKPAAVAKPAAERLPETGAEVGLLASLVVGLGGLGAVLTLRSRKPSGES